MSRVSPSPSAQRALAVVLGLICLSSLGCGDSTSVLLDEAAARLTATSSTSDGAWTPAGRMGSTRLLHTATRLADGRVLVTGGYNRSAELYDPATGTWSRTADALDTHRAATATLLPGGRVLIAGAGGSGLSAELYDAASGTWRPAGNLATPRFHPTATLLPDGRVLVTGGADGEYGGSALSSTEVYDPATGTWTPAASMAEARRNHTATALSNGRILVTGGSNTYGQLQGSAEVYDPATGRWSPVGPMAVARASHSATLLPDGTVLVVGGGDSDRAASTSAELFHPATGTWTMAAPLAVPRRSHSATLLPSGRVLVTGGFHEYTGILTSAEVYEPTLGTWLPAGSMATGRYLHTATLLTDGRVLAAGGASGGDQASAEVYGASGPSEPEEPMPSEPAGTSLLLQVVDTSGQPIPGAAVSFQGAVFPVDTSGHRLFENLPSGRLRIRVDALGFTSATTVVEVGVGAHVGAQVKLLPLGNPIPFQAETGGLIQTEQVRVSLPPGAVVDALGQPVTGTVNVTVAPLDPTRQLAAMPGPLEGLAAANGASVRLESFFMAEVSLWSKGAPVQLAPGRTATLEFLLPEALASRFKAGDTVPAWWFDLDAGHWREEGTGTVQASSSHPGRLAWVAQVKHFTWWNADAPWTDKSCVDVLVVDGLGAPVRGAAVNAAGVSYPGASGPAYTSASGHVCIEVKRGQTADLFAGLPGQPTTERVRVTGTSTAAACGGGSCTAVQLVLPDVLCSPGAFIPCAYSGPEGTEGRGSCQASRRRCNVTGTEWSVCQGQVLPAAESCQTPFDDDCDGVVNELCFCSDKQGQPCYGGPSGTQGVGSCHGGVVECDEFGTIICRGQQLPMAEACWTAADEDCNGVSEACETGPSGWASTGFMVAPRRYHTATLLPGGKVLVAGGGYNSSAVSTAELYDPATGTWSGTGSMATPRGAYRAAPLPDGKVLVSGGNGTRGLITTAEVYDPTTGTWSATGSMTSARNDHTATPLPGGKVLVAGGYGHSGPLVMAELYDPATGTWSATGSLNSSRYVHTAALLPNGKVLVAGGYTSDVSAPSGIQAKAEVYDPATGTWSATGSLALARYGHSMTLLPNGKVLVVGGYGPSGLSRTAELYDPASGTWSATGSPASPREFHTATLLPNGKVLVTGGYNGGPLATAEVYDPVTGTWSAAGSLPVPCWIHTATLLPNGKVLVAGGFDGSGDLSLASLYTP
ncbi:carboxypeptidase regulatory-like domain-containing protein [Archangium gephyra]|uniref:kelch repeat-containing protein n=1 Tax=Archangium gephyra TaxID=48 RepID=UPI0035D43D92